MARRRKKEPDFPWSILVAALITFVVCIFALMHFGDDLFKLPLDGKDDDIVIIDEDKRTVSLYYLSSNGIDLTKETRRIAKGVLFFEVQDTLDELLKGPKSEFLTDTLPKGTEIIDFQIKDNVAFIDFSNDLSLGHGGGSTGELATVYSIVNTVMLNFKEIKGVQILVNGVVRDTLAGHIMINHPLSANKDLIS